MIRSWFQRKQTAAQPLPAPQHLPDEINIGLRDMALSGWFNSERGELFAGFPITRDDVVLDVGCGDGSKVSFCARQGAHVIFVDVDPERVARAADRMADSGARELTPIVSDSAPLPLPDGIASKLIASEVLEHVEDPAGFIDELVRVGRPGATYFLTVPDASSENLQRGLPDVPPTDYFLKPNHIRVLSHEEFRRLVTDAGLIIESSGAHGFYASMWWLLLRTYGGDLSSTNHPAVNLWANTWEALLATHDGLRVKAALDEVLPKTQWIIARKPQMHTDR